MSDGKQLDRRTVLKSTGAAVAGTTVLGATATGTAAASDHYEGHLEIKIPYTNADIDIRYTIDYAECDAEISFEVEGGVWEESNHYDCYSRDSHAEFDVGVAEGEIDVEVDFESDTVHISAEACANYFAGTSCESASKTVSF